VQLEGLCKLETLVTSGAEPPTFQLVGCHCMPLIAGERIIIVMGCIIYEHNSFINMYMK
jgi:hypothetical protein